MAGEIVGLEEEIEVLEDPEVLVVAEGVVEVVVVAEVTVEVVIKVVAEVTVKVCIHHHLQNLSLSLSPSESLLLLVDWNLRYNSG